MSQQELLSRIIAALNSKQIPYMLTGGLATSLLGLPRYTQDIDLVVDLPSSNLPQLTHLFPEPEFYVDQQAAEQAIASKEMFQLLELASGDRVDFHLLTKDSFDTSRFARRQTTDYMGQRLMLPTAEDLIIQKLRWAKQCGGSEKQLFDVLTIYEVQKENLDMAYIRYWVNTLELGDFYDKVSKQA